MSSGFSSHINTRSQRLEYPSYVLISPMETILITRLNLCRSYGHFRYGSNPSPYYRNCSCYSVLAKPKLSQPITYSRWGLTGPCISPTGCFAISQRAVLSPSPASRARYRRFFILTFSGFTIPSMSNFSQPPHCAFQGESGSGADSLILGCYKARSSTFLYRPRKFKGFSPTMARGFFFGHNCIYICNIFRVLI